MTRKTDQAFQTNDVFMRNVLDSMEEALVAYNAQGHLTVCNQAFRNMYGYTVDQVRPGIHFRELGEIDILNGNVAIGDDQGEDYLLRKKAYRKLLEGSFTVKLRDGRWIRTTDRRTPDGGFVSVQVDVTEIKAYEEKLLVARREAETANLAKSEFLANMSHELRTPLNAIIGFSQLLQVEAIVSENVDKNKEYSDIITSAGVHLLQIIGDILDLSKIEAGENELSREPVDIGEVIKECLEMISGSTLLKPLSFLTDIQTDLPTIQADRLKVIQILLNLLSNAVKFTPSGGKIEIGAHVDKQSELLIEVKDTGVGISQDDLKLVMEPFGQAGNTFTRSHDGSGLGLALVSSLSQLHGGSVGISSELGVGTTVTVRFPVELNPAI